MLTTYTVKYHSTYIQVFQYPTYHETFDGRKWEKADGMYKLPEDAIRV